jgi:hypothetical protein
LRAQATESRALLLLNVRISNSSPRLGLIGHLLYDPDRFAPLLIDLRASLASGHFSPWFERQNLFDQQKTAGVDNLASHGG